MNRIKIYKAEMGAFCDTICSRSGTIYQTLPDSDSLKSSRCALSPEPEGNAGTLSKYIDQRYTNGNTLLHIAVQQGDHNLIAAILKNGAAVNVNFCAIPKYIPTIVVYIVI